MLRVRPLRHSSVRNRATVSLASAAGVVATGRMARASRQITLRLSAQKASMAAGNVLPQVGADLVGDLLACVHRVLVGAGEHGDGLDLLGVVGVAAGGAPGRGAGYPPGGYPWWCRIGRSTRSTCGGEADCHGT